MHGYRFRCISNYPEGKGEQKREAREERKGVDERERKEESLESHRLTHPAIRPATPALSASRRHRARGFRREKAEIDATIKAFCSFYPSLQVVRAFSKEVASLAADDKGGFVDTPEFRYCVPAEFTPAKERRGKTAGESEAERATRRTVKYQLHGCLRPKFISIVAATRRRPANYPLAVPRRPGGTEPRHPRSSMRRDAVASGKLETACVRSFPPFPACSLSFVFVLSALYRPPPRRFASTKINTGPPRPSPSPTVFRDRTRLYAPIRPLWASFSPRREPRLDRSR